MWLQRLRQTVESHIGKGATLVVAVSGGGDSVALLHGLHACHEALNLRLVVVHLDHALRPESAEEAAFVGNLALAMGWMSLRERVEVAAWAAEQGKNVEDAARRLRYTFFDQSAKAVGATAIAVAHTQDDQAETVIMHLLRGAGLEGLRGMSLMAPSPLPTTSIPLFRPLLGVERETLRAWLRDNGYAWREDGSNADTHRFRSAVRHRYLPLLEEVAPALRERLAQTASLLAADADLLQSLTEHAWQRMAQHRQERIVLARSPFLAEAHAIQRRLVRRAYETVQTGVQELSALHITQALNLIATGQANQQMTLPGGIVLTLAHDGIWMGAPVAPVGWHGTELPAQGEIVVGGKRVTLRVATPAELPHEWGGLPPTTAFFDANGIAFPLTMRPSHPNDQWQPYGMGGREVSLREWFSKQKVPHHQRSTIPLLVDANGQILWVAGWRTAHIGRVTEATTELLRVEVTE